MKFNERVNKLKTLRGKERELVAELIRELSVMHNERSFVTAGYPSLFVFCVQALGYSEGAAWRRSAAAKALSVSPELYQQLRDGQITLYAAAELSKVVTAKNSKEIINLASGCSKQEVKELVADFSAPRTKAKQTERVRVNRVIQDISPPLELTSPEKCKAQKKSYTVTLELDEAEMELINQAQVVLSTRKVKDTVLKAAKRVVAKEKKLTLLRERRAAKLESPEALKVVTSPEKSQSKKPSRYIPADVRHAVTKRDNGRCSYVAPDGTRCCETNNLEFDHRVPFALGGQSTVENLRLVCRGHNRMYADNVFGREWVEQVIKRAG